MSSIQLSAISDTELAQLVYATRPLPMGYVSEVVDRFVRKVLSESLTPAMEPWEIEDVQGILAEQRLRISELEQELHEWELWASGRPSS